MTPPVVFFAPRLVCRGSVSPPYLPTLFLKISRSRAGPHLSRPLLTPSPSLLEIYLFLLSSSQRPSPGTMGARPFADLPLPHALISTLHGREEDLLDYLRPPPGPSGCHGVALALASSLEFFASL